MNKEKLGWLMLAEKSMTKIWDNEIDDNEWSQYLKTEQTRKNKLNSNRKNK